MGLRGLELEVVSQTATLLKINMEVERAPYKTTILYVEPSIGFHVNLGEGAPSFLMAIVCKSIYKLLSQRATHVIITALVYS